MIKCFTECLITYFYYLTDDVVVCQVIETGNETIYETFRHKLTDTYDIVRIDDLGRQTVVDGGKEPRFRSTI